MLKSIILSFSGIKEGLIFIKFLFKVIVSFFNKECSFKVFSSFSFFLIIGIELIEFIFGVSHLDVSFDEWYSSFSNSKRKIYPTIFLFIFISLQQTLKYWFFNFQIILFFSVKKWLSYKYFLILFDKPSCFLGWLIK